MKMTGSPASKTATSVAKESEELSAAKRLYARSEQGHRSERGAYILALTCVLLGNSQAWAQDNPLDWQNAYPARFVRITPPGIKSKSAGDYYKSVLKATNGKNFRFKTMPIAVFVSPSPNHEFIKAIIAGFDNWEDRTNGLVRFVQVDKPDSARIKVIWSHLGASANDSGCTLGAHTITRWKAGAPDSLGVLSAQMMSVPYAPKLGVKSAQPAQVIEVNLDLIERKDPDVRNQILQNVVTHELGHTLGILGHSPNIGDMMYPVTDEHSRLSQRDINTIMKIYSKPADVDL